MRNGVESNLVRRLRCLRSWRLALAIGFVAAVAVAVGLSFSAYVGSASATPGKTCNPDPGHGAPGCHQEATTTTAAPKPTTTTAKPKPTTTTAKPTATTVKVTATTAKSTVGTTGGTTGSVITTTPTPTTAGVSTTIAAPSTTVAPDTTVAPTTTSVPTGNATPAVASPAAFDASAPAPYMDQNNCLACHSNPDFTKARDDGTSISLFVDPTQLPQSVHRYQDCTTCHSDKPHEVQTPLTKLSLAEKCGSCHQYELGQYLNSIHGSQEAKGNVDAATCTDCHSANSNPHNVVRVLDPAASTYPKNVAETCAKCHNDPKLMGKYGIVEKVYDSYMRSFHGKAMKLASDKLTMELLNTATCVSCHGSHNIKAVSDPTSPVAGMDNLAKTCEQCHPGAGAEFASGFLGHKAADPSSDPQVFWGEKFFYVFTRAVLAGGVVLVAMPLGRWSVGRIARRGKSSKNKEE